MNRVAGINKAMFIDALMLSSLGTENIHASPGAGSCAAMRKGTSK